MKKDHEIPDLDVPLEAFQAMIEHAPLPMAQLEGPDHVFTAANQGFCDLLKKKHRDLIGKPFAALVPAVDVRSVLLDQVRNTGRSGSCIFPADKDSGDLPRSYSCWPLHAADDVVPTGLILQVAEFDTLNEQSAAINAALLISSVHQHELTGIADLRVKSLRGELANSEQVSALLQASELQLRTMADSIPQMVWMARPDGHMFWYNQRWLDYTGTTLEEGLGWGWQRLLAPAEMPQVLAKIVAAFAGNEAWEDQFALRRHDGVMRWHLGRMMPVCDPAGEVVRWFGTYTDITDEREMEQELRQRTEELAQADTHKNEFLATLAHELRSPLAPLLNGLELIKLVADDRATVEKTRRMMIRQVEHMMLLIVDLMDLSRISRGIIELHRKPVDLRPLIEQAVEASRPVIETQGHMLVVKLPHEPLIVDGDSTRLTQVFSNLLNNAAKYTPPHGAISVHARQEATEALITFKDNGIGIAKDQLTRIFDMFSQVQASSVGVQGGLGIGLNIGKHLVGMHDGRIEVRSDGLHTGSSFTVHLPLALHQEVALPSPPDHAAEVLPSALKILVADDNEDTTTIMSMMLTKLGHVVSVASNGLQAVAMGKVLEPDLVLMDLGMPLMGGLEACKVMKEEPWGRAAYIVALTGWGQDDDRRKTTDAGFDHHLVKPVGYAKLTAIIAQVAIRKPVA